MPKGKESAQAEDQPWADFLESAKSQRPIQPRHMKAGACTCVTVDVTVLNPEEILLALEANGLYNITEARSKATI